MPLTLTLFKHKTVHSYDRTAVKRGKQFYIQQHEQTSEDNIERKKLQKDTQGISLM